MVLTEAEVNAEEGAKHFELLRYLELLNTAVNSPPDWEFRSIYAFLQRYGKFMTKVLPPLPPEAKMPDRECFSNALHFATEHDLFYCEGYAVSIIPMLHAWCVTRTGEVIDPTWAENGKCYYGAIFPTAFAREFVVRTGYYGLLDCWSAKWPLLSGEVNYGEKCFPFIRQMLLKC